MSNRNAKWENKDGLFIGFGTRKSESNSAPQVSTSSVTQEIRMAIKGTELNDVATAAEVENGAVIPAGAYLVSANVYVSEAFTSGGVAVLDLGLLNAGTGVITDDDGIDAAVALAALEAGDTVACDGALIGTQLAAANKVIASYDTAAYTAGAATLVVRYVVPTA
jgi:hypothetical protein